MENDRPFSEMAGNRLKGALVRAYTAQRDHFLELYARSGHSPRSRPVDEGKTGQPGGARRRPAPTRTRSVDH